jgi:hypothetical protein
MQRAAPGPGLVEEAVHPYISQALAAERVQDRRRKADRALFVRQARALRNTQAARPAAPVSAPQPATATQPGPAPKLVQMRSGPAGRGTADSSDGQRIRAA